MTPFDANRSKRRVAAEVWRRFGAVDNYVAWISQRQFFGCRPQRFVALLVDQRSFLRALANEAIALAREAGRWIARCAAFVVRQRLPIASLSVSSSLWWIPMRGGIGPFTCSQTMRARSSHLFGSATLMNARRPPPRPCRVLIRTAPTGKRELCPCPSLSFMEETIS